ncbi:MAG: flagellar filament capping protein FliD [Lachnospiraceae bacterium]|nr:flagellar filament capping protein FliD [Lachnospiraceae bacterium]
MSSVNTIDYNSFYSTIFGNSSSSSNSMGLGGQLADYASIRNGSYAKLLKAHYAKQEKEKSGVSDEEKAATNKAYSTVKSSAEDIKSSLSALDSASLYEKGSYTVTSASGEKSESEYNYDAIYDKLSSFVDNYNSLINSSASENAGSTHHLALNLASSTARNSNLLAKVGISSDTEGKLSIDRDKLNSADVSTVKTLFSGSGSYGDSVSSRASMMMSIANNKLGSGTYNNKATAASAATESIYSSTV